MRRGGRDAGRRSWLPLLVITTLAFVPTAEAKPLKLGFSLKHLGSFPREHQAFKAVAPSMDRTLTAVHWAAAQKDCRMIRQGRFDWGKHDRLMRLIERRDQALVVALKDGPKCSQRRPREPGGDNPRPEYVDDYAKFARKFVQRYGKRAGGPVRQIEVWSEQNLKSWQGSVRSYQQAFIAVEKQVRRSDRSIDVIVGGIGFCCNPARYTKQLFKNRKFRRVVDHMGAHTYASSPRSAIRELRRVRRELPKRVELVITETGWSTCPVPGYSYKCQTESRQARWMNSYVSSLRRQKRRLKLTGFYWFQPQDMATQASVVYCQREPKEFYGIYDHEGFAKPSRDVWSRLTKTTLPDQIEPNPRMRGCREDGKLRVLTPNP